MAYPSPHGSQSPWNPPIPQFIHPIQILSIYKTTFSYPPRPQSQHVQFQSLHQRAAARSAYYTSDGTSSHIAGQGSPSDYPLNALEGMTRDPATGM